MRVVHFAAPVLMPATLRFLRGVAALSEVRLGLLTGEPLGRVPGDLRERLAGHWRSDELLDQRALATAIDGLSRLTGPPDRIIGVLEQLQETLAAVREERGLPGMKRDTARNFRDKDRMKTRLREVGVPCARHGTAETEATARDLAEEIGFPVVVKPPAGSGARATFRIEDLGALESALVTTPPTSARPWLVEEYVTGDEHSFDAVTIDGATVWHSVTRYLPTPLEVLEKPWIQWCVVLPREVDDPRYDEIRELAPRALSALGMETGMSHLEWFRRPDGSVAISEVAARPPGAQITQLMAFAHDFDIYREWGRLVVEDAFEPPERRYAAGVAFLRAQGEGRVRAVRGLEEARHRVGELVVEASLPEPGQPSGMGYEGEGYVLVRHPDTAIVVEALHAIITTVRVEVA